MYPTGIFEHSVLMIHQWLEELLPQNLGLVFTYLVRKKKFEIFFGYLVTHVFTVY